jgi:hypothetical protein
MRYVFAVNGHDIPFAATLWIFRVTAPCEGSGTALLQPNAVNTGTAKRDHRVRAFIMSAFLLRTSLLDKFEHCAFPARPQRALASLRKYRVKASFAKLPHDSRPLSIIEGGTFGGKLLLDNLRGE